jgi:hypothetical protein
VTSIDQDINMEDRAEVRLVSSDPITLSRTLLEDYHQCLEAKEDFCIVLSSIQTACKYISSEVQGRTNTQSVLLENSPLSH